MATRLTGPLNQLDVYRIVHDFDRDNFKTARPLPNAQVDRVIVIIQLERMLVSSHLTLELIDKIMRRCLEDSPSVGALLMYYKNTPAIVVLHPLPLSHDAHYINTASRSLIVQLKQAAAEGESYQQLMTWVFAHHFKKLTLDQKLDLIRRSNITPWQQKSTCQQLELLGRIQAPTLWGKAKVSLQFLSWKVQFAAVWADKNQIICLSIQIIILAMLGTGAALVSVSLLPWIVGFFPSVIIQTCFTLFAFGTCGPFFAMTGLESILRRPIFSKPIKEKALLVASLSLLIAKFVSTVTFQTWKICFTFFAFAASGPPLAMAGLGLALQFPIFPKSIKEKGAWLQSVSKNYFLISLHYLAVTLQLDSYHNRFDEFNNVCTRLEKLLFQSINEAKITTKQETFAKAQLPMLINQWINLISPIDTDTGSSLTLQ